ncbi:MAG: ACT domain-containing protein [Fervidicoccus sp.]|nr:MAG: ACT domain-containing protein [Fervidicoccus sp.]
MISIAKFLSELFNLFDILLRGENEKMNDEQKISVAEAVRFVISKNQSLIECLSEGLVNYTWLAERIADEVARISGRKRVNLDAIKAALIRYEEELKKEKSALMKSVGKVLAKSTLELQNDIVVLTVKKYTVERKLNEILEAASRSRFFNFTQGKKSYTFVISEEDEGAIEKMMEKDDVLDKVEKQSALIMISPYDIMFTPGVVNFLTRLMYLSNINITQIMSCYTDTILIINKDDSVKAFKLLQDVIEQQRSIEGNQSLGSETESTKNGKL